MTFFIFWQHCHLSAFSAFDEVDMFLDRSNGERLARMIKQQAGQAQFIFVSFRRPMI
jgi:chromosome segregation protein